jgi:DNA-binding FrmR family transcriptional regulator
MNHEHETCPACHQRHTPRSDAELRQLKNRISRMTGQLNGIGRMLDENRYCGDILIQISAVQRALQNFGYAVLQSHMEACVAEEIREGNTEIIGETVDLMKKLK